MTSSQKLEHERLFEIPSPKINKENPAQPIPQTLSRSSSPPCHRPRSFITICSGSRCKRHYTATVRYHRRQECVLRMEQNVHQPGIAIDVIDENGGLELRVCMDIESNEYQILDFRNGRDYLIRKVGAYYIVYRENCGLKTVLAVLVPNKFKTSAEVKWVRPNSVYGQTVARLSRPLMNQWRLLYWFDCMDVWFDAALDNILALGLQICFMCLPRHLNLTRFWNVGTCIRMDFPMIAKRSFLELVEHGWWMEASSISLRVTVRSFLEISNNVFILESFYLWHYLKRKTHVVFPTIIFIILFCYEKLVLE